MKRIIPYADCDMSFLAKLPVTDNDNADANFQYLATMSQADFDYDADLSYLQNIPLDSTE
jgi:hypothetical protein